MPDDIHTSFFRKALAADPSKGGVYINKAGQFVIEIDALKGHTKFNGVSMFIAECKIRKSSIPDHPVGSSASWIAGYDKPSTPGNVHAFFIALFPGQEINAEGMAMCIGPDNPCHGALLHLETALTTTRAGKPFTLHKWRALTAEELKEFEPAK